MFSTFLLYGFLKLRLLYQFQGRPEQEIYCVLSQFSDQFTFRRLSILTDVYCVPPQYIQVNKIRLYFYVVLYNENSICLDYSLPVEFIWRLLNFCTLRGVVTNSFLLLFFHICQLSAGAFSFIYFTFLKLPDFLELTTTIKL